MPHLLLITTANLATNPRLCKEIDLALKNRFKVSVLCFGFDNWSKPNNEEIKKRLLPEITYHEISGDRTPFLSWTLSSLWFICSKKLLALFPLSLYLLSVKTNKRSWLLLQNLKKVKEKIDLVIAHNPGSFYPSQVFSKKHKIPFGVDLEDYHPGEYSNEKDSLCSKKLLKYILPKATYISSASSLILDYAKSDINGLKTASIIILNYFPAAEFIQPTISTPSKLSLVWFSQNISYNRGLEKIIPFVKANKEVELHLYGNCNEQFKKEWLSDCNNIFIYPALPQAELHKQLANYDIGLAIEPGKDLNNELAISNKLLAYLQAGLYIIASDTKAQRKFINEFPEHGMLTALNSNDIDITFQKVTTNIHTVRDTALQRFEHVKSYSWENESAKLLRLWSQVLHYDKNLQG